MVIENEYQKRKEERKKNFDAQKGLKLPTCTACSGSGHYKAGKCGACSGTGKTRESRREADIRLNKEEILDELTGESKLENIRIKQKTKEDKKRITDLINVRNFNKLFRDTIHHSILRMSDPNFKTEEKKLDIWNLSKKDKKVARFRTKYEEDPNAFHTQHQIKKYKKLKNYFKENDEEMEIIGKATDKLSKEDIDLIDFAKAKQPLKFNETFDEVLKNRIESLLNAKKVDISSSLLKNEEDKTFEPKAQGEKDFYHKHDPKEDRPKDKTDEILDGNEVKVFPRKKNRMGVEPNTYKKE